MRSDGKGTVAELTRRRGLRFFGYLYRRKVATESCAQGKTLNECETKLSGYAQLEHRASVAAASVQRLHESCTCAEHSDVI